MCNSQFHAYQRDPLPTYGHISNAYLKGIAGADQATQSFKQVHA